jgi:hypothetical protein
VLGGGFVLSKGGVRVGGLGVSGDTSCTDHMIGWRTRGNLNLDGSRESRAPRPCSQEIPRTPDNIIFDIKPNPDGGTGISASGFGHATCLKQLDAKSRR